MCTGIRLNAQNKDIIYARTLEFAVNVASNILIIPRHFPFTATAPENQKGLCWKSKYAVVGANALNLNAFLDGINEKGLAGGLFYFPDYAQYQEVSAHEYQKSLASWELLTWILTNFSSVQEVAKELTTIKVNNAILKQWQMIPPVHCIIHDLSGDSLVIEYLHGNLVMHKNPIGVFTNSPSFDWHITNLRNYINLSAVNVPKVSLDSVSFSALGQGSGMFGIPGDFTSPSRFVRAVAYSQSLVDLTTAREALYASFHVLNLFDIPKGTVREKEDKTIHYEYTQWTSASDLKNKRYYFHTYDNRTIRMVDLMKLNLNAQEPKIIPMQSEQVIIDMTGKVTYE